MVDRLLILTLLICPVCLQAEQPDRFGFGRSPTLEEIKRWDFDIMPDGKQLPPGEGSVTEGEAVYQEKCMSCHGKDGRGGVNDQLSGEYSPGINFATDMQAVRTIGNYWPYATTLYDYIYRAMPYSEPGSLTADEVYGLVAYLLYINGVIDREKIMNAGTLPEVTMPARHLFYWSDEAGSEKD